MGRGKSGMLEHESGNISETRKDRGKVTMDCRADRNSPTLNALPDDTVLDRDRLRYGLLPMD